VIGANGVIGRITSVSWLSIRGLSSPLLDGFADALSIDA
jgi:hypothetical protein